MISVTDARRLYVALGRVTREAEGAGGALVDT